MAENTVIVEMPDGNLVEMPSNPSPELKAKVRAKLGQIKDISQPDLPPEPNGSNLRFGAEHLLTGAYSATIGAPPDIFQGIAKGAVGAYDWAKEKLTGSQPPSLTSLVTGEQPQKPQRNEQPLALSTQWFENQMKRLGLFGEEYDPKSPVGRVVASAIQSVPSAVLGNPQTLKKFAIEAGKAAASGASAQVAAEAGLGVIGQALAAGVPHAAPLITGGSELVRRGIVKNPSAIAQRVSDAREIPGFNPSVAQATGNTLLKGAQSTFSKLPGGVSHFHDEYVRNNAAVEKRVNETVESLSRGERLDPDSVSEMIQKAVSDYSGEQFKDTKRKLWADLSTEVPPDTPINVATFRKVLEGLAKKTSTTGEGGKTAIDSQLQNWIDRIDTSLGERKDVQDYRVTPNTESAKREQSHPILGSTKVRDVMRTGGSGNKVSNLGTKTTGAIHPYMAVPKRETIPFSEVTRIMSEIGEDVRRGEIQVAPNVKAYRAAYAGLKDAVKGSMPTLKAQQKLERYYEYASDVHNRIRDVYQDISSKKESRVTSIIDKLKHSIGEGRGGNYASILMQSLPAQTRDIVRAHILEDLGKLPPSMRSEESSFSMSRFLTRWKGIDDNAKRALFDKATREKVDRIAAVLQRTEDVGKYAFNSSGSGAAVNAGAATLTALSSIGKAITGDFAGAAATAASGFAGYTVSRSLSMAMTNPKFVDWLYQGTKLSTTSLDKHLIRLQQAVRNTQDPSQKAAMQDVQDYLDKTLNSR